MIDRLKLTKKQQALVQRFISLLDQMKDNNIGIVEVMSLDGIDEEYISILHFLNLRQATDFDLDHYGELEQDDCYMDAFASEPENAAVIKDLDKLKELAKIQDEYDDPITYCVDARELPTATLDPAFWKSHFYDDDPIVMVEYENTAATRKLVKDNLYQKEILNELDRSHVDEMENEKERLLEAIEALEVEIAGYQGDESKQHLIELAQSDLKKNQELLIDINEKISEAIVTLDQKAKAIAAKYSK